MIQRYDMAPYAMGWEKNDDGEVCMSRDVKELEAKYAKLNKHCLALFSAVCGLTCQDMTTEERVEALQQATEAKSRFADDADDSDFWHIVDLDDNDGGDA